MQTIVELYEFQRCVKNVGISETELDDLKSSLAENPELGIPLGSGLFKIRLARQGGGKSGGYRVVYFYRRPEIPLILISAFAKNTKLNLTPAELRIYRQLCDRLEEQYRSGR